MERQNIVARDFLGLNGHNDTEMEVDRQEKKEPPGSGSDHIITLSLFKECEKNYPACGLQLSSGFESNRQGNFQEGIVSGGGSVPYNLGSFLSSTGSRGTTVKTGNASGSVTGERPFAGKPCFHAYNTEMQRSLLRFANSSSVTKENVQPATEKTQMNDVEKFVAAAGKLPDGLTESDIQQREEFRRYFKDKVSVANMAMQWPYWNKATALQQFVSFKDHQEERPEKRRYEQIAASGLHPVAAVDAFKSNQRSAAVTQKAFNLNPISRDSAETGNCYVGVNGAQNRHFVVSPLARTFDGQSFSDNSIEEAGVFAKENLSLCVSNFKEHLGSHVSFKGQQTTATSCATPPMVRSFSGIPVSSQPTVLNGPVGSSVGTAATRVASNGPGKQAGAQLTIFYAGTVNVYDEIPPDKAHTIMLLAGSGSSLFPKNTDPPPQRFAMSTALAMSGHSRPATPTVCSNLSSVLPSVIPPVPPLKSQASLQPSQSTGLSSNSGESHTTENSGSANDSQEAPKQSASGPMPTAVVPRALPQARKASLTRFLEKRKERVPSNMPYPMKKSPSHSLSQREKSLSPTSPFDGLPSSQHDLTGDAVDEKSLTKSDGRKSFFNRDREEQLWSLKAENKNEER